MALMHADVNKSAKIETLVTVLPGIISGFKSEWLPTPL